MKNLAIYRSAGFFLSFLSLRKLFSVKKTLKDEAQVIQYILSEKQNNNSKRVWLPVFRSGGPGGQKVNKTESRWIDMAAFSDSGFNDEQSLLFKKLGAESTKKKMFYSIVIAIAQGHKTRTIAFVKCLKLLRKLWANRKTQEKQEFLAQPITSASKKKQSGGEKTPKAKRLKSEF